MNILKIIFDIIGKIFGFIFKIFKKLLSLVGLDKMFKISKTSYFLIPTYLITKIMNKNSMIGGVTPYLMNMNQQSKPVYQQPTPVYTQPTPVYTQPVYTQQSKKSSFIVYLIPITMILIVNIVDSYKNCTMDKLIQNSLLTTISVYIISLICMQILEGIFPFLSSIPYIGELINGIILFGVYNFVVNFSTTIGVNKCKESFQGSCKCKKDQCKCKNDCDEKRCDIFLK